MKTSLKNLIKLPHILDMTTRHTELVLPFYYYPVKSYEINNFSDSKHENKLKTKQTVEIHYNKLHH